MPDGREFAYQGPPELLPAVAHALAWVVYPLTGRTILQERLVRRVTLEGARADVQIALPDDPVSQVVLEDVEAELFDHLQGGWAVRARCVPRVPLRLAWAAREPAARAT